MTSIAITTYQIGDSFRLAFFKRSIFSLSKTKFNGNIYIVDDGSIDKKHLEFAISLRDPRIMIEEKSVNGGIAKAKNTSIRKILEHDDIGFLADDDIEFKEGFDSLYVNTIKATGIAHLSLYVIDNNYQKMMYRNYPILGTPIVNGCFLTITKELIQKIGYFKMLPHKHGHEHSEFSTRAVQHGGNPFFCDAVNSRNYLALIPESIPRPSIYKDPVTFRENEVYAFSQINPYEPLVE